MRNIYCNKDEIQKIVKVIASKINRELLWQQATSDENLPDPVFICVLNGAYRFFTDLTSNISVKHEVDFIRVKSYSGTSQTSINMTKPIETDVKGRIVYIVDDIYDTGNTIQFIRSYLEEKEPADIRVVTLIERDRGQSVSKYNHLLLDNLDWVYGYGMDLNGVNRHLNDIYRISSVETIV